MSNKEKLNYNKDQWDAAKAANPSGYDNFKHKFLQEAGLFWKRVSETEKGYVVEVGNQRLQALKNLGVDKVTCILSSKKIYEKLKKVSRNLYVAPNDINEWDADIQFKGQ